MSLQNTLERAFENLNTEPSLLSCPPLDKLYENHGVGIVAWKEAGTLFVSVGFEGAADVVYSGLDHAAAAKATVEAIEALD